MIWHSEFTIEQPCVHNETKALVFLAYKEYANFGVTERPYPADACLKHVMDEFCIGTWPADQGRVRVRFHRGQRGIASGRRQPNLLLPILPEVRGIAGEALGPIDEAPTFGQRDKLSPESRAWNWLLIASALAAKL